MHIEISTTADSGFQPKEYSRNLDCGITETKGVWVYLKGAEPAKNIVNASQLWYGALPGNTPVSDCTGGRTTPQFLFDQAVRSIQEKRLFTESCSLETEKRYRMFFVPEAWCSNITAISKISF